MKLLALALLPFFLMLHLLQGSCEPQGAGGKSQGNKGLEVTILMVDDKTIIQSYQATNRVVGQHRVFSLRILWKLLDSTDLQKGTIWLSTFMPPSTRVSEHLTIINLSSHILVKQGSAILLTVQMGN